ncbi:WhiB family transcriptional regulator [Streptomyces sp. NPDC048338]|uniref:WhiB family transcriptional regulator n=1 Tax=Streptomyces sp. NPDC048338 TaxID=3365536 RepID=UPI0037241ED9
MLLPDSTPWQAAAACVGLSPSVVFARRAQQAAPALRACAACPVSRECETAVAPAESYFDGVCAGRLWRNGRPVVARRGRHSADTARRTGTVDLPRAVAPAAVRDTPAGPRGATGPGTPAVPVAASAAHPGGGRD